MADEMKELRGAVFDLIPDGVSVVALDEIEVDDMAPKTRNVKDEDSNKQHRVDDERFGGLVYKLPGVAVRDCRRKRIRDKVSVFVRQRPCLCSISCCGFSHDDFSGLGRACRPRNGLNWMVLVSPPERTGKDYDQHAPSTVYPSFAAERGIRRVDRAENTCQRADGA